MRPSLLLASHRSEVREIALRHRVSNIRIFGSAAQGTDTEGSDLDVLVEPMSDTTLMDVAAIQVELEKLLGISVDVLTPNALPDSFRKQVLRDSLLV